MATSIVITQIAFSADEFAGGVNKIVNPRSGFEGHEGKPIKYLIGEYLGETGEKTYDIIDISLGLMDIPKSDKLIDLIGGYDTISDAKSAIEEYKKDEE